MQLLAALLILLAGVVGGAFILEMRPDALSKFGLIEQSALTEPPKPRLSTGPEVQRLDPSEAAPRSFDVAKIAPDGTSVFAGQSTPNAVVTVFADGEMVGTAHTDANGEWVLIVDHKFANPDPKLSVQVGRVLSAAPTSQPILADAPSAAASSARLMDELEHRVAQARAEANRRTSAQSETMTNADAQGTAVDKLTVATAAPPTSSPVPYPAIVPIPIKFVFRTAEFTPEGQKAAGLLLQYIQLRQLPAVSMTGHADERGTHEFNMGLSSERLEAVAAFLRAGGYKGRVALIPKGDLEPFTGVDRSVVPREQLYDLDRRVELYVTE